MKFLETITAMGESMLVPVDKINYILIRHKDNGWQIKIDGGDLFECVEHFGNDDEKLDNRYRMIKYILKITPDDEIRKAIKI